MKNKNYVMYFVLITSLLLLKYNVFVSNNNCCTLETKDIANMYENYIEDWKNKSKRAFDEAEAKIFTTPKPPVVIVPMEDPDPAKCICKGTGIIIHGDGHKTPCQYHGINKQLLKDKELKYKQLIIIGE
ncbi:MAG: hypothetical protein EBU90_13400 [Proteobacteria bacterium]|nr:hypothetical protein [Pseudomonadota bacterium]NBP15105.1 hypothetical protein [bacterium]